MSDFRAWSHQGRWKTVHMHSATGHRRQLCLCRRCTSRNLVETTRGMEEWNNFHSPWKRGCTHAHLPLLLLPILDELST